MKKIMGFLVLLLFLVFFSLIFINFKVKEKIEFVCGDGICEKGEDIFSCFEDCKTKKAITARDVIDWNSLQDLNLKELKWKEKDREKLSSGVTVISGTFSGGYLTTYNSKDELETIELSEKAVIYLPAKIEKETPGIVRALHVATNFDMDGQIEETLVKELNIAIINHGEFEKDWEKLGLEGRDELTGMTFKAAQELNPCKLNDYITGNFGLALAKVNVRALTLLERILEKEGGSLGDAAMRGGSKEGYATWLASAVDSRVTIAMPGGFHLEEMITGLSAYEENSGCEGTGAGNKDVKDLIQLRNWMLYSPAGQEYYDIYSVSSFVDLLYPKDIIIAGDVGVYGMHDANFFSPGAETPFLENFKERDWRYDRKPNEERDAGILQGRRLAVLAWALTHGNSIDDIPKILSTSVYTEDYGFRIEADISPTPKEARLWWSHSKDREFDDKDNDPWFSVPLEFKNGKWVSNLIKTPYGHQVGWYVEAEDEITIGRFIGPRYDASPMNFLFELPKLSCEAPKPNCS